MVLQTLTVRSVNPPYALNPEPEYMPAPTEMERVQTTPSKADEGITIQEVEPLSFVFEIPRALPGEICRGMIRRFEANPAQQHEGRIGQLQTKDRGVKSSTDLTISNKSDWKDIDRLLFQSLATAMRIGPNVPHNSPPSGCPPISLASPVKAGVRYWPRECTTNPHSPAHALA